MVNAPLHKQVKWNFNRNGKQFHPLHFISCILMCHEVKIASMST
uniref:Uncharacterized protein n=1 Tax=Arundo donax TaxID=35708 RepID=A0A0A9EXM2_ARUDO